MDSEFFGCGYEEWMEVSEEECPECGYPTSERQIESLGTCGRCYQNQTDGLDIEDKKDTGIKGKNIIDEMKRSVKS